MRGNLGARRKCYFWVEVRDLQPGTGILAPGLATGLDKNATRTVAGGRDEQGKRMNTYCFFYVLSPLLRAAEGNIGVQSAGMVPRWLSTTCTSASQPA